MLRCYDATLAYVRTPLKNRKYITCNIYLYICGGVGLFFDCNAQHLRNTSVTTPYDQRMRCKKPLKFAF